MLTLQDARDAVERIKAMAHDDEAAHNDEDDLRRKALEAIAEGCPYAKEMAEIALSTEQIDFARWCA